MLTPMKLINVSNEEWESVCNGEEAYSNLAPALLSVSVIREGHFQKKINNLTEEKAVLNKEKQELLKQLQYLVDTVVAFPTEISEKHYSIEQAKQLIKKLKE